MESPGYTVTPEMLKVEELLKRKQNVLLIGPGGTGKSKIVTYVCEAFTRNNANIACTATTGVAALNVKSPSGIYTTSTLHRWAGIKLGRGSALQLVADIKHQPAYHN